MQDIINFECYTFLKTNFVPHQMHIKYSEEFIEGVLDCDLQALYLYLTLVQHGIIVSYQHHKPEKEVSYHNNKPEKESKRVQPWRLSETHHLSIDFAELLYDCKEEQQYVTGRVVPYLKPVFKSDGQLLDFKVRQCIILEGIRHFSGG